VREISDICIEKQRKKMNMDIFARLFLYQLYVSGVAALEGAKPDCSL